MAITPETITIKIDEAAINGSVKRAIESALVDVARQFRDAAAVLDPPGIRYQDSLAYQKGFEAGKAEAADE